MEITTTVGELRERTVMIGLPMYGGNCSGLTAKSLMHLVAVFSHYGIKIQPYFMFNESLITRARNYIVDEFLRSNYSRLLFIDSDIGFDANDVIAMLSLQSDDSEYDVLCGVYPKKTIAWEKVKTAVDMGIADKDPRELSNYIGDFVFNPLREEGKTSITIQLDRPVEVMESGTGFMLIHRRAFEKLDKHLGDSIRYRPDHTRMEKFDGSREISMYFQAEIVNKRYLSEDYWFSQKLREAGGKVWICPWIKLDHVGSYTFSGSIAHMAQIRSTPTADPSKLRKKKK